MNVLIDTSSLLAFIRYYLPFDRNGVFKNLLQTKFEEGELILLDKVYEEAKYMAKGVILKELNFLSNKNKHTKTNSLIPSQKFFNLLENQFCNKQILRLKGLNEVEFELAKTTFLVSADANLLLYSLSIKAKSPIIVTEETEASNDQKIFKKIPENCKSIGIECCTLPVLFKQHYNLKLSDYLH